jgi:hypothetical protein
VRPRAFIAVLFVMAFACLGIAISDTSFAWFIGAIVFLSVGLFARRLGSQEDEPEGGGARLRFVAIAMLVMVAAIVGIAWLASAG